MMKFAGLALAAMLMVLPGCGGDDNNNERNEPTDVNNTPTDRSNLPDWYTDRSMDDGQIHAWGSSVGEQVNGEQSAKASAQREMAETVNTLVQGMFKRYTASTARGEAVLEERDTRDVLRTITNQSISGFVIDKIDYVDGIWYARGTLGLPEIKRIVRQNKEQIAGVIEEVKANADAAFADLDAALEQEFNDMQNK